MRFNPLQQCGQRQHLRGCDRRLLMIVADRTGCAPRVVQGDHGLLAADARFADRAGDPVHHECIRIGIARHDRFAQPVVGIDDSFVEAVVQRVQREGHARTLGIHLLLDHNRNPRVCELEAMLALVEQDAFVKAGCEGVANGRGQRRSRDAQGGFVAARKGSALEVFLRRRRAHGKQPGRMGRLKGGERALQFCALRLGEL